MTAAPSAINPSPWPADAYTRLHDPMLAITYAATLGGAAIPLWNIRLTISETSSPTATLEADTTAAALAGLGGVEDAFTMLSITTGYAAQAQARIFHGPLTSAEIRSDGTGRITAASADFVLDRFPANPATYTVPAADTKLADVITDLNYATTPWAWYGGRIRAIASGTLTNPSSYTAFRQQQLQSTDTTLDFLIACANALGQWLRGDQRGRASSGFLYAGVGSDQPSAGVWDVSKLILSDRWDSGTPIDLTAITESWTRRQSADDYASLLAITARYKAGGTEVTKTARYGSYILTPPITRSIDVAYRAGAAFTAGTDPVAQAWVNSYAARSWTLTATCRAVWWLEPGHQATVAGTTGTVTAVTFNVDQGTMTVTLRPTTTWTPA
jgi:hypothetical protein